MKIVTYMLHTAWCYLKHFVQEVVYISNMDNLSTPLYNGTTQFSSLGNVYSLYQLGIMGEGRSAKGETLTEVLHSLSPWRDTPFVLLSW